MMRKGRLVGYNSMPQGPEEAKPNKKGERTVEESTLEVENFIGNGEF
jgi:hypothetical protein